MNDAVLAAWARVKGEVESPVFTYECELASGWRLYRKAIRESKIAASVRVFARYYPELVLARMTELAQVETDPKYQNENDTAICTYAMGVLDTERLTLPQVVLLLSDVRGCFWVHRMLECYA